MRDSAVEALTYSFFVLDPRHDFSQAEPWEGELGDFQCRLEGQRLTARPSVHFPDEASARDGLEPHLRAWELRSELQEGLWFEFRFVSALVVDRNTEHDSSSIAVTTTNELGIRTEEIAKVGHSHYPLPSGEKLGESSLVSDLRERARGVRHRTERMLVGGYLILTSLEKQYGSREGAAAQLEIGDKVLDMLGRLTNRNDPQEGRKAKGPIQPLTEGERKWLLAVIPDLVYRVAEAEAGKSNLPKLTMSDFPRLWVGA